MPEATESAAPPRAGVRALSTALAAGAVGLAFAAGSHLVVNSDLFWHLLNGRWMLENGRIPVEEIASHTARGAPWYDYEWLWELCALGVWRLGGGPLTSLVTALLAALTAWLLWKACRETGAAPSVSAMLVTLAVLVAGIRFQSRPENVTYPLLALTLWCAVRWRADGRGGRLPWLVVPLYALWANLHPGFLFGLGVIGAAFLGELLLWLRDRLRERPASRRLEAARRLGMLTGACALATLACPRPFGAYLLVLDSLHSFKALGFRNLEWEPMPFSAGAGAFWLLLALTAIVLVWNARRADPAELIWIATFAYLALSTQRSGALFALAAAPVVARALHERVPLPVERAGRWAVPLLLLLLIVQLLLLGPAMRSSPGRPGYGVEWSRFPVGASEFVERESLRGEMFNHFRFGGYLGWRFHPERPVFIDGKHIPYIPFLRRLEAAQKKGYGGWSALMSELGVEYALLSYDYPPQGVVYGTDQRGAPITGMRAWSAVWFHRGEWALVYWDDTAMVLVRRDGPNADLAARREYRSVNPEDGDYLVEQVRSGGLDPDPLLEELERRLGEDPPSRRAASLHERLRDAAIAAAASGAAGP